MVHSWYPLGFPLHKNYDWYHFGFYGQYCFLFYGWYTLVLVSQNALKCITLDIVGAGD